MNLEDFWCRTIYACSLVIEKAEDLSNIRSLLEQNYRQTLYFNDFDNEIDLSILSVVHDTAVCDKFDQDVIRKAFAMGLYPLAMTRRICHRRELPKHLLDEYDANYLEVTRHFPAPVPDMGNSNQPAIIIGGKGKTEKPPFFDFYATFLTIRYHDKKLIVFFDNFRVPKKVPSLIKNKFADYTLTFNKNFKLCLDELKNAYRGDTWLYPQLTEQLEQINSNPDESVSVDSVEIWHDGRLVAGELGFTTGNVYASLSGFHKESDIGTVQMSVLGLYLKNNGYAYWDLGMEIDYKYRFGAVCCDWDEQDEAYEKSSRSRLAFSYEEMPLVDFLRCL